MPDLRDPINGAVRRVPAWTLYLLFAIWAGWEFWKALTGQGDYAVEPINVLERTYGEMALRLLVAGLLVTPLRQLSGINLMKFRRAIGVTAFWMVLAHFMVWAVLDVQTLARVWTEIVKRPYVTVGMLAFVGLIPLALTSNNWSVRKLGAARWRQLHKLTYPICILAGLHYLWLVKGFQLEPLIYLAIFVCLIFWRFWPRLRPSRSLGA